MNLIIVKKLSQVAISLEGGQVISWSSDDIKVLYKGSSVKRSGIPILFPYANPLEGDVFLLSGKQYEQHGFARDCLWKLEEKGENFCKIVLDKTCLSQEMRDFYPFDFKLIQTISLSNDNLNETLSIDLEVYNLGSSNLPIAPGLHPYFSLEHDQKSNLTISGIVDGIVGGIECTKLKNINWEAPSNGYFFKLDDDKNHLLKTNLSNSSGEISLEMSPNFQNLVLWSQSPIEGKLDYNFICLEPFSRETNAINTNPIIVKPGEKTLFTFKIIKKTYES